MTSQEYEPNVEISEELQNRLKNKGMFEQRIAAIERFNETPSESIHHGLNIKTDLEFLKFNSSLNEGTTKTVHSHKELFDSKKLQMISLHEFVHNKNIDLKFKENIIHQIAKSEMLNNTKLDFLHSALSNITLIIGSENLNLSNEEYVEIERTYVGNTYNHVLIIIQNNSHVNFYFRTIHETDKTSNNNIITDFFDVIVADNSKTQIIEQRIMSNSDIAYGKKSIYLGKNSNSNWINIDKNCKLAILEQHAVLSGENSNSVMSNIVCGKSSEYSLYNISEHDSNNTTSLIQNKIGLKESKAVIRGLVKINENAHDSNGYQKSDTLMLDDKSRAISIPDLEIHNDKVKCTHGSTITRLDIDKIFYLQSRGLSREEAAKLIIEGFYDTILNDITNNDLKEKIKSEVISHD